MTDAPKHEYPTLFAPGLNALSDECWRVLDNIKPGVIPFEVRCYLHGAMLGLLHRHASPKANSGESPGGGKTPLSPHDESPR